MSLPAVDSQPTLFGSIAAVAGDLFAEDDRYRLFARKVWPVLAGTPGELAKCYCSDNGRPGIEPVVLSGVWVFQFLERLPDRQALELVKYRLGVEAGAQPGIGTASLSSHRVGLFPSAAVGACAGDADL